MQSTRQKIMDFLEAHHRATAVELSQVFNMTQANIRHHLSLLVNQGQVEIVGQNPPNGRGRPTLLYMPTRTAQSHSLDLLLSVLLDEIQSVGTPKQRERKIKRLADGLISNWNSENKSLTLRLGDCMQQVNKLQYQAHWEARADSPLIIFGKCPYTPVIEHYPELCTMDKYLLEKMLDCKVDQISKITRRPEGPQQCQFIIHPDKKRKI